VSPRAAYALALVAAALAWALARRRAEHRPIAALLTVGLVADVCRRVLAVLVLNPAHARLGAAPFTGWPRVAGHVGEALFLAWPAAIAAAALTVFHLGTPEAKRRAHLAVLGVYVAALLALVVTYPITRGDTLVRCYLAANLAAIVAGIGAIGTWVSARRLPEAHHFALALVVMAELVSAVAGPWRADLFGSWSLAQVSYALLLGVLIALQGGLLWISTSRSR
jgi:hypothetical protein